jgi:hypothetical protein
MKKVFLVFFPIFFSLIVLGCSQPSGDDGGGTTNLSVKISNQSSIGLYDVTWNGVSFYTYDPTGYVGGKRLSSGDSMTVSSSSGSSYVFFRIGNVSVRTQEILSLDDKPVVFTINDNTIVVGSGKTGPLSTF